MRRRERPLEAVPPPELLTFAWHEWTVPPSEPAPFRGPLTVYTAAKRRWKAARAEWAAEHGVRWAFWTPGVGYSEDTVPPCP